MIDYSLHGYMSCTEDFAASLGVNNIFLVTENATVIALAPQKYPQYSWYTQRRTRKSSADTSRDKKEEKVEVKERNKETGKGKARMSSFEGAHQNEQQGSSKGQELANTLVSKVRLRLPYIYLSKLVMITTITAMNIIEKRKKLRNLTTEYKLNYCP
jgi:hypothetical protein